MTSLVKKIKTTLLENLYLCQHVGTDEAGNKYYERAQKTGSAKRWVLYHGQADGSKVPATWHAWLHHATTSPAEATQTKPHLPNLSGTAYAHTPRPRSSKKYQSWTPEENTV